MAAAKLGISVLTNALSKLGGLAPKARNVWTGLTHGLKPAANNTVTSIVKAAPAAAYVKPTRGVLHPLSLLSTGVKLGGGAAGIGFGAEAIGGLYDWTSGESIGKGTDLTDDGTALKDGLNSLEQLRARLGSAIRGDLGGLVVGPSDDLQAEILNTAKDKRNKDFKALYSGLIADNRRGLGGLAVSQDDNDFEGKTQDAIERNIKADQIRAGAVDRILGIEGGIEKLAELDPNISTVGLTGVATNLNKANRQEAEAKIERKERQLRDREDANTRLTLLLDDQRTKRQEAAAERLRADKLYYDSLDRRERRAQRRDQRIRDERQSQREMISLLLGGLDNL